MSSWKQIRSALVLGLLVLVSSTTIATALQSSSSTYGIDQAFFGNGGQLNACSSSYCTKQTAGETAVGNSSSANFQVQAGNNTDRTPYIEFIVNNANINLGQLSSSSTTTANATFSVKTYLAGGYTVLNASPPPQNGSYTMHNLTSPTASSIGNEQFGINLVANTTGGACNAPANFGAVPSQAPDSTFGFGQVASGYNTCGLFKYVNGDQIAYSNSSSGETDYTISYIFNITAVTPGGTYTMNHVLVATSTY